MPAFRRHVAPAVAIAIAPLLAILPLPAFGQAKPKAPPVAAIIAAAPPGALFLGSPKLCAPRNVSVAAFAPDGKTIVSAQNEGEIELWDAAAGHRIASLGTMAGTTGLAYSADGATLYACAYSGEVRQWKVGALAAPPRVVQTGDALQRIAVSPDGKTFATGGKEIRLWATSGKPIATLGTNGERTTSLSFSADGKTLVSAGFDRTVRVWDVAKREAVQTINVGDVNVSGDVSPDGKTIATGGGGVRLRDASTGKELARPTFATGSSTGGAVRFSPDGKLLAIDSLRAGGVIVYDVDAAKELRRLDVEYGGVIDFDWSPDGKRLLVYDVGPRMQLWDVDTGKRQFDEVGHRRQVLAVAASPDGTTVATGDANGHVILWNALTGKAREVAKPGPNDPQNPFNSGAFGAAYQLAFASDGAELIVRDAGGATGWSLDTFNKLSSIRSINGYAWDMSLSADGSRLTLSDGKDKVDVWDRATDAVVCKVEVPEGARGRALSADGKSLFVAVQGLVRVFDATTGKPRDEWEVPRGTVTRLAASPDGRWVAGAGANTLYVWRADSGEPCVAAESSAQSVGFSGDGALLATAGGNGVVEVWELATARRVTSLKGHAGTANAVAFLPNGRRLVSGADDATAIVWDLAGAIAPTGGEDDAKFARLRVDRLWRQLDDADPAVAYRAVASLVRTPDDAMKLLSERMTDRSAPGRFRAARADAILCWIDTPDASELRAKLAATAPAAGGAVKQPPAPKDPPAKADADGRPRIAYPQVKDRGTFHKMVEAGDWRVLATVFPVVDAAAGKAPAGLAHPLLPQALDAAGEFRVTALRPSLLAILRDKRADVPLRERAAIALARLGDDADTAELTAALDGGLLGTEGRFLVAVELLPRDVDAARVVLVDGYKEYLGGFADQSHFALQRVRDILEQTYDEKLVAQIEALGPAQTVQTAKNNISTLVEAMRVWSLPADELVALAESNDWATVGKRYGAIHALGRVGGPEHVERLGRLKPWPKGSGGDIAVQQKFVGEFAQKAVAGIRRRHWQHYLKLEQRDNDRRGRDGR